MIEVTIETATIIVVLLNLDPSKSQVLQFKLAIMQAIESINPIVIFLTKCQI